MVPSRFGRRMVPMLLGIAMLAVVIAAALSPNVGVVQAQTNNQYNQGPSSTGGLTLTDTAIIAVIVAAAIAAALVLLRRRRQPPAPPPMLQSWQGGGGAGPTVTPPPPMVPPAPPSLPPSPPPGAAPAYLETPEDVGQAPPTVSVPRAGAAATGSAAAAEGGEADIDSLMAELDKISGEILKRTPKKGAPPPSGPDTSSKP